MADDDAVGGRQILLELRGVHLLLAAAVADRHLLRAEQLRLHGGIDRRHAAADDHDAAADGQRAKIPRLTKGRDELDRVLDALGLLALSTQRVDAAKPQAEEHGIIVLR